MKILRSITTMTALAFIFTFCSKDDDAGVQRFSGHVDVGTSSLVNEKYHVALLFSSDGGTTWTEYPKVKPGQQYKVKAAIRDGSEFIDLVSADFYEFDWSASLPAPKSGANEQIATFDMKDVNEIVVKVSDMVCAYSASSCAGSFSALEDYGAAHYGPYTVSFVQNANNPNRFDFDNFYDSGYDAYIEFDPTTGTVKFPDGQSPGGKAITKSSGTFDQCRGILTINLNYDGGDWIYHFTKE